jgi:hypothetical protein
MQVNSEIGSGKGALLPRLVVGVAQGLFLAFLAKTTLEKPPFGLDKAFWAQLSPSLLQFAIFAPLPLLFGFGNLPARKLAPWAVVAGAAVFAFAWFASAPAWRGAPTATWLFSLIVIYIIHEFVQAAHDDGKRIASYPTYFDRAWRHSFQAALAIGFAIAFWIVIQLGAWLFRLIGLEAIYAAINSEIFRWLASSVAFALGIHLTDADAGLTRGARQIGLALLSWLALLMTLILAAFLAALPFTGLEALWDTKRATVLLLNAAATMILLVNAAFQAGDPPKAAVMRAVVRFSPLPLIGIVGLAALGLWLRIDQYGLTPARVLASAELMIVAVYAVGYVVAAVTPGAWLSLVKPVNIAAALFVAATLTALMTPLADPARLAVADQVARLDKGVVEPDDFDFGFLADQRSGRWGAAALEKLAKRSGSDRDDRIALLAANPVTRDQWSPVEQSFNDRRAALALIGDGVVPDEALMAMGEDDPVSSCVQSMKAYAEEARLDAERRRQRERLGKRLTSPSAKYPEVATEMKMDPDEGRCPTRLLDLDLDGDDDLLILANDRWNNAAWITAHAIISNGGDWRYVGAIVEAGSGNAVATVPGFSGLRPAPMTRAERRAAFAAATVVAHPYRDFVAEGRRLRLEPVARPSIANAAALVEALDDVTAPAAILEEREPFSLTASCRETGYFDQSFERACYSRLLDVDGDGRDEYALISIQVSGSIAVAAFDAATGDYLAAGSVAIPGFWETTRDTDQKVAREKRAAERRRIAAAATLAEPLLGDLVIGGATTSFGYAEPPTP